MHWCRYVSQALWTKKRKESGSENYALVDRLVVMWPRLLRWNPFPSESIKCDTHVIRSQGAIPCSAECPRPWIQMFPACSIGLSGATLLCYDKKLLQVLHTWSELKIYNIWWKRNTSLRNERLNGYLALQGNCLSFGYLSLASNFRGRCMYIQRCHPFKIRSWSGRTHIDSFQYLAQWVPSPPGKHTSQKCTIWTSPKAAGRKKTRYPLGWKPPASAGRCRTFFGPQDEGHGRYRLRFRSDQILLGAREGRPGTNLGGGGRMTRGYIVLDYSIV